ncbi:RdRP-domain-containing protein [Trichoderma citrinoviride]|uniref:RNA-dependent RNA polymerase n=1 Tax=Trichoderma citrinoviride TaxID=58853 RepID=A0A2T4BML4_9HYPO|nr:RdRP-domain-containing protein [Trichoderma citrinoviride]PTB70536.1 RdRP-domain-containing protein [Trichoderma citrinoviride]
MSRQPVPERWLVSRAHPDSEYPSRITANLSSLDFGSLVAPTSINIRKSISSPGGSTISMEVDVLAKCLIILFPLRVKKDANTHETRLFKILAELSQTKTIFKTAQEDGHDVFIFPFTIPPQYYWRDDEAFRSLPRSRTPGCRPLDMWRRATDISEDATLSFTFPVAADSTHLDPAFLEVGRWTALRVVLSNADHSSKLAADRLLLAFEDRNINLQVCEDFRVSHSSVTMWDFLDHHHHAGSEGDALALLQSSLYPFVHLDFGVRYQLEVCVGRRMLNEHTVSLEFLQGLAALDPLDAKRRLEYLADQGDVMYDPMELLNWTAAASYMPNTRIPHYCVLARKAAVTPTTILLSTPVVETSNRVLRYFNHIQDRFLRVQFVEETEIGRMAMNSRNKEDIWKKLLRTLYQGIQIGDRHYQFLAFGSSQLRQCGAYFFCPTDHISCDDIRRWMGEVGHIRIVAKYAARLGQCFSTTREMRGLPIPDVRSIPDIERNGYCFTDGVGIISDFMAQMIVEEMTLDVYTEPSAFQFRMGGCKGVLVIWPQAKKGEVYIRKSQEKFKAEVKNLEIIKCAKYSSATLNRQTITILECLGVTKKAFLDILEKQIRLYEEAMGKNEVAIEMLTDCVDENQSTLVLAELLQAGFKTDKVQEPFVANLLSLWRSWSLKLLKEKARIPVEKSAFVLGCVDETATLRGHSVATEGSSEKDISKLPQIFLQVSDSKIYKKMHVVKGLCVVGRNPSLHPGDIRVVEAVDIPALHHLKDVVVFPSTGDRPVPNMLSGGDLDGDDFFVIWEPTLLPELWNHPAMSYSSPTPETLDREVNVDDLRDFFVKYMKNDVLPLIATAHLAFADSDGPLSKICLHLAELHSQAVDYPKTGQPAEWNPTKHNPPKWPHFMEKKNSYPSPKVLGDIYDRVKKQSIQFQPDWETAFDRRILNRFELDNAMLKDARRLKSQYDGTVRRILVHHNLDTEFELYTSWAMSKPPIGSEYKRQEDLGKEFDAVKQRFRDACIEAAGGHDEAKIDRFVAAMYKVTEQEVKIALFEHHRGPTNEAGVIKPARELQAKSMPLISFPWIFPWVMIRVATDGKCKPKDSVLAAAHRRVPVAVPSFVPLIQQEDDQASKDVKPKERAGIDGEETEMPDSEERNVSQQQGLLIELGDLVLF